MDREEAIKILKDTLYDEKTPTDYLEAVKMGREALESQKTGHWIDLDVHSAVCSCCYKNNTLNGDFCKWCGAKMKGGNNE